MSRIGTTTCLALAALTASAAFAAPPAGGVSGSGRTLASSQLATDILNKIAEYNRTTGACPDLSALHMEVLPRDYVPRQPAVPATSRGGHFERWSIDACGSRRQFQVGMWPSPQGGSDYAVTPLPGRIALPAAANGGGGDNATRAGAGTGGTPQASSLAAWNGRYVWEESLGRIGGASPAEGAASFVTYTLALGPGNGATNCRLTAEGFQTNTRILCTATPEGPSLVVKFYKFGPDDLRGRHTLGERLLTLTRDAGGITTRLEGLQPASDTSPRRGRLFQKQR